MSDRSLRTLLVGIDAASSDIVNPLIEAGELPNLERIVEGGAAGPLESQLPPWTPSAWPSLYTGTNPGKHGAFSFLEYDGYDWDVIDSRSVHELSLWDIADHHGLTSVVVNVPVTSPPPTIDGALVPGFTAPDNPPCHPEGLLDDIREAIGDYRVYAADEFAADADDASRRAEYADLVAMRGRAFRYLAERFDPDFGFLQFQQSDTVVHDYPGDRDLLASVYRAIDAEVGAVIDECDPETVIVASDHGIGPYEGQEFRVNEYLRRHGYLETTRDGRGRPSWVPIWEDELSGREASSGTLDRLLASNVANRTLSAAATLVARAGLTDAVRAAVPDRFLRATDVTENVDFEASTAYLRLPVELGVRINLAGREPAGIVPADRYESTRESLIDLLSSVRTPDGDPVFDRVVPREEVFEGPFVEKAPDIVTVPAEFEQFPAARVGGDVFGPLNEPWNHKLHGFLALSGPGVDAAESVAGAHLLDVAPTVLATLGLPASDRMDGAVLPPVDPAGEERYPPARPSELSSRRSDEGVENRLADLGYL